MKTAWVAVLLRVLLYGQSSMAETTIITSTDVNCQNTPRNFLTNPSVETGDINPWGKYKGSICSLPLVIRDSSDDGNYAMKIGPLGGYWAAQQTVTGLTIGTTYTLSYDYKPTSGIAYDLFIELDGHLLASAALRYSPRAGWKTISGTWEATSTSHTMVILIFSQHDGGILELDNA
jgi:hypothetical protein